MRRRKYTQEFVHPELKEGEVFFSNCDSVGFAMIPWWSKRKGMNAYTGLGQRLRIRDWFPVFVSKDELVRARIGIQDARQEFRTRIEHPETIQSYSEALC